MPVVTFCARILLAAPEVPRLVSLLSRARGEAELSLGRVARPGAGAGDRGRPAPLRLPRGVLDTAGDLVITIIGVI